MLTKFGQALLEKGDMSGLTQKGGHKRSTKSGAGLTQKGVDAVNRKTGGNLKTAVTTPPSKLKPDSKPAKRRKSFCARSSGWTGERGKAARSRWNCSTDINTKGDLAMNERIKKNRDAVRQMTSGQTPAEAKAQRSLTTANPDWITSDDKKSPRQQAHDSRRGVRQAREALSNAAIDKMKKEMSDNLNASLKDAKKHKATSGMRLPKPKVKDNQRSDTEDGRSFKTGVRQAREALAEACWKGYKAKGMKKKGSKMVPNCVKEAALSFNDQMKQMDADRKARQAKVKKMKEPGGPLSTAPKDTTPRRKDGTLKTYEKKVEEEADPTKTTRASIKQGEGDANVYSKIKAKKDAASKPQAEKSKSVRRETLGRSGGMHDKKGTPANPSSNHPDYLKKKLHQRATKDGGYGKEGETKAADTKVNQKGVRGHEAAIAKKKAGSERQAKAQRISNKIRAKRGLVPLMPGEKHSSNDKLGKTEN